MCLRRKVKLQLHRGCIPLIITNYWKHNVIHSNCYSIERSSGLQIVETQTELNWQ